MRRFKVLSLVVFLIAGCMACKNEEKETGQDNVATGTNAVLDAIYQRTSIRAYTEKPVSKEDLETIVRAGMAAPSAMNKQPWQFIVVDDKEILHALGENLRTSAMVQKAPAAILVCGDMTKAGEGWLQEYWIQDCSAASQNILLAITSLGLGGVWTSIFPATDRIKHVADILKLPEHIVPLNIIPLGYPSQTPEPKDKWQEENVRWNAW